jgi:hypothetical protein
VRANTDPFAQAATSNNQWVVEGPHLMVIVPDTAQLESLSTDPHNGGPYVMWKGTPYAILWCQWQIVQSNSIGV